VIKSFRYRIYPTKRQTETLNQQLAICCEIYNAALQERREAWKLEQKSIGLYDQINQLPAIRKDREDVARLYSHVLRDPLVRVDNAFKAFFRRLKSKNKPGYPRFKSARRYDSLVFTEHAAWSPQSGKVRIAKVGEVRVKQHRAIEGEPKTLTIKREAGRWFAIFVCDIGVSPLPFNSNTIGVDVGLSVFATLSNGTSIDNPRWLRNGEQALRIAQRKVKRRKKGSDRRHTAVLLLQRAYAKIRQQRSDFHHKLSRTLIDNNGLIAVEDLNIKGLASGRLSKSVNDAAWSNFIFMLSYKAENAGRLLVKVNPRGTSQTCLCGAEVRKTLKDRLHVCLSCGLVADRDHVSAQLILERGLCFQASTSPVAECVA